MATRLVFTAATTGSIPRYLRPYHFLANNGYYRFDGFLSGSKSIEELSLTVRSGDVISTATNTKLVFGPDSGPTIDPGVIVPRIYLGKLANYPPYSTDQTLLVVIPGRTVAEGNAICAFWQWTVNFVGLKMVNFDVTTSIMTNVENVGGYVSFQFTTGIYTFHATVSSKETAERQQLTLLMTSIANESTGSLTLELQDLRPSPSGRQPDRDIIIAQLESKLRVAQLESQLLESQLRVAQLESRLRVAQDEDKLLNTKLLETERSHEKERS
jgi:hypothetical protein